MSAENPLRNLVKNDAIRGNKELLSEPYYLVRRGRSNEVDEVERVFY